MSGRSVRVFLSSTFRDFGEERDLLVRRVFPTLRARLQSRFVDLVDVDLRWGITEEEAERGEVLPICLSEIDRARPYFIGLLGERYGWIPAADAYPADVLESQPWLEEHRGGKSITELEFLHGVLNNPQMEGRVLFYYRSPDYSASKGRDYIAASADDEARQSALKETIRKGGFPVYEDYKSPEHLAEVLEQDLWEILDHEFPVSDVPDEFARENLQHEAYALPRQRLYIGGDQYLAALDAAYAGNKQWILVTGSSGCGKSALIANWLKSVSDIETDTEVHAHYLGATADATDPVFLVRRLIECIKRKTESTDDLASDPDELLDSLPTWLASASSWCQRQGKRFLFVIDALNGLSDRRDLRWFPRMLPKHVHLVVSTLPGEVYDNLQDRADWSHVSVTSLDLETAKLVFKAYLALFNKTLPDDLTARVMAHALAVNPLFLLTLAEELRLFGEHEQLSRRLDYYLNSLTVDDLFERVLERIEQDYGAEILRKIMVALWAARAGLRDEEILGYTDLKPMHWAYIRNGLGPTLIDASGRLIFAHDYMRIAVSDRYMAGNNTVGNEGQSEEALDLRRTAHRTLGQWFESYAFKDGQSIVSDERAAEEIPHQWREAEDWETLRNALTRKDMVVAILDHRSEGELLAYWLSLKEYTKTDIESEYEAAWKTWRLSKTNDQMGDKANMLANFLSYAGRYGDFTERLFRLRLKLREKALGPDHCDVATSLNDLGGLLSEKGDYDGAEPLYRRALEIHEKALGPGHPDVATSLNNLGVLLDEKGDYDGGELLLRRSLEIREKALGPEHPYTAYTLNNLGANVFAKGDKKTAEKLTRRALAIREKILGPQHLETAYSLNNLGALLNETGDYDGAELLLRRSLEINEKMLGPDHPETAYNLNLLGILLRDKGDYAAAEQTVRRALEINEKRLGPEHRDTDFSISILGGILSAKGDNYGAELLLRRALEIREKALGLVHPRTVNLLHQFGIFLRDMGRFEEALATLETSNQRHKNIHGENSLEQAYPISAIGQTYFLLKNYEEAEKYYKKALDIRERLLEPDDEQLAIIRKRLDELAEAREK